MTTYTKNQVIILTTFSIANFCSAVCVSLQAPFYPQEAESKGATATQYGFVFGVFELTVFIASPIYGKFLTKIGANFMFTASLFTVGCTCILFGLLDKVVETTAFITLSFVIRSVEALGNAGFLTSLFSIVAKEFSENIGSTFAILETCFGVGLIVGPTVGGGLYEVGGFTLPFVVLGTTLISSATVAYCVLPTNTQEMPRQSNLFKIIKLPSIAVIVFAIISTSFSLGFLQAALEPHLRPLHLTPFQTGLAFMLNGSTYALSAPFWGWLCDKYIAPRKVILFGAILIGIAFLLIGPSPFIPLQPTIWMCVLALLIHGLGFGAALVATFGGAHKEVMLHGFPDDLNTYGLISGMWASAFALGAFVGPTVAGYLLDVIGFRWATCLVVVMQIIVIIVIILYDCIASKRNFYYSGYEQVAKENETTKLTQSGNYTYGSSNDSCYSSGYDTPAVIVIHRPGLTGSWAPRTANVFGSPFVANSRENPEIN